MRRGPAAIEVDLTDAGAALGAARPVLSRSAGTAADVVRALAGAVEVTTGRLTLDLPLAAYVADEGRTAGEHIARLAGLAGAMATVDGDGTVAATPPPEAPEVPAYGREITAYRVTDAVPAATVVGDWCRAGRLGRRPGRPGARRAGAARGRAGAGRRHRLAATPLLRVPAAAVTATDAHARASAATARRLYARTVLLPVLRPGTVVQIQDLPGETNGGTSDWLLTRVRHRVRPGPGSFSELDGVAAGVGGGGLLGAWPAWSGGCDGQRSGGGGGPDRPARAGRAGDGGGRLGDRPAPRFRPPARPRGDGPATRQRPGAARVPVAVGLLGFAAIPAVGDLVLVLFIEADRNAPVVVGRLYHADLAPPEHDAGEVVLRLPAGSGDPAIDLVLVPDTPKVTLDLPGDVHIEITEGRVHIGVGDLHATLETAGGGRVEVAAGGSTLTLKKDGDVSLKAAGNLTLEGTQIEIKGSGTVAVKGASAWS